MFYKANSTRLVVENASWVVVAVLV